jgi:FG-GAP-like repeat/ASPIC and UnbV
MAGRRSRPEWRRGHLPRGADGPASIGPRRRIRFPRAAWSGWIALLVVLAWPGRLGAAAAKTPEICAPDAAAATKPVVAVSQPESTRRMAALLAQITHSADPMRNPFRSTERVPLVRAAIARTVDPEKLFQLKSELVQDLLQLGNPDEALKASDDLGLFIKEHNLPQDVRLMSSLLTTRALCYLRMGEQENCLLNHNADSCLFPIKGGGVHQLQRGSRGAVAVLTDLLTRYPGDLQARWLLNIAYMTLGEYPAQVPAQWVIDPKLFASDYDIKRFPDVAANVGLDRDGLAGGVVVEDFDNDGLLDVMISGWGLDSQLQLFHNNGDGTFKDVTEQAGLSGELGGLNLIQCDYNNDGLMDVLVLRGAWLHTEGHYPLSLLRNNGDGTFTDVTEDAGLLRFHPTGSAVWFDYNNDGWLDLFVVNESDGGRDTSPCELFRNNGDGTFTECAAVNGVDYVGFFKGVASADYNNDGRPDLFLSRLDGAKMLLRNDGPAGADKSPGAAWRFTDVADAAGVTEPFSTFPCWFFDYNNDGWPDIMVTGYSIQDAGDIAADYLGLPNSGERAKLYRNNGDGTFADVSQECGVDKVLQTMGCNFGDLDNDGWLDFYVGTGNPNFSTLIPNRMFRNDGGKSFQDVTTSGGFGQLQKGHGIAFGDINNDGEQDIFSVVGGAFEADHYHSQLFANPGHGNNWLKLKLEGIKTNRAAIGARIKVVVQAGEGERAIYRTVGSGASFGAASVRQEIGVGPATVVKRVEIFWPVTGVTQVVTGLQINQFYQVREGTDQAVKVELKSFKWPTTAAAHHHHQAPGNSLSPP